MPTSPAATPQHYYRLSGAGNDFIALVEPEPVPDSGTRRRWCRRGLSVGADGILILERDGESTVRLGYFNADGERAELCVNGTRAAAQLAFALGWAAKRVTLRTDVGDLAAERIDDTVVRLEAPRPSAVEEVRLETSRGVVVGHTCRVGVPHLVVEIDDLETLEITSFGRELRHHEGLGPEGANVDFVGRTSASSSEPIRVRTFERGVEGETLACGSGVLATAAVALHLGRATLPLEISTRGGCRLAIAGSATGAEVVEWTVEGDARVVSKGEILSP